MLLEPDNQGAWAACHGLSQFSRAGWSRMSIDSSPAGVGEQQVTHQNLLCPRPVPLLVVSRVKVTWKVGKSYTNGQCAGEQAGGVQRPVGTQKAGGSGFINKVANVSMVTGSSCMGRASPFPGERPGPMCTSQPGWTAPCSIRTSNHGYRSVVNTSYSCRWFPAFYFCPCRLCTLKIPAVNQELLLLTPFCPYSSSCPQRIESPLQDGALRD